MKLILLLLAVLSCDAAIALVQTASNTGGNVNLTASFGSATTAGSYIVAVCGSQGTGGTPSFTVSDSQGNTYTMVVQTADGNLKNLSIGVAPVTTTGSTTVTCNAGHFQSDSYIMIREYSGAGGHDVSAGAIGSSTTPSTTDQASSGSTSTRTTANQTIIGAIITNATGVTAGTSFGNKADSATRNAWLVSMTDRAVTSTGTNPATFTPTDFKAWIVQAVTLKESGGGGGGARRRLWVIQ